MIHRSRVHKPSDLMLRRLCALATGMPPEPPELVEATVAVPEPRHALGVDVVGPVDLEGAVLEARLRAAMAPARRTLRALGQLSQPAARHLMDGVER